MQDPGVHNWLDAFDNPLGSISYRIYEAKGPKIPIIKWVKLAELDAHLPADTKRVTLEERKAALRRRRHSGYARWNI